MQERVKKTRGINLTELNYAQKRNMSYTHGMSTVFFATCSCISGLLLYTVSQKKRQ